MRRLRHSCLHANRLRRRSSRCVYGDVDSAETRQRLEATDDELAATAFKMGVPSPGGIQDGYYELLPGQLFFGVPGSAAGYAASEGGPTRQKWPTASGSARSSIPAQLTIDFGFVGSPSEAA